MPKSPHYQRQLNETELMEALVEEAETPSCAKLHALLAEKRQHFNFPPPFKQLPLNGVYFIFEKGQSSHAHPRIVRIGSHTGRDRLVARLWEHAIPHGRSYFRYDLGKAIIEQPHAVDIRPVAEALWKAGTDRQELDRFEVELSEFIRKQFQFSVIGTLNQDEALKLERECIATVAHCDECKAASKTSILKCAHGGHLWNQKHTGPNSNPLSASNWQRLVALASNPLGSKVD